MNDGNPLPLIIALAVTVLMVASFWKVFTKAGQPGWASLVPIYNGIVLLQIAGKPLWWIILFFVPIANLVVALLLYVGLAQRFGKGAGFGVGLALLGVLFFPILAFGDARYLGPQAGDGKPMSAWVTLVIAMVAGAFIVLPLMAAVAIPAFMRYMNKAKSTEAEQFLKKMSDGAMIYYHSPTQPGLTPVPKQWPNESVGPTPPAGACCASGTGKCAPDPELWNHPTWMALNFSIEDAHHYSYQYEVIEGGKGFVARAIGDLDCDGTFSTFELTGAQTDDGSVRSSFSIMRVNEME